MTNIKSNNPHLTRGENKLQKRAPPMAGRKRLYVEFFSFQKECAVAVARKTHFSKKNAVSTEGYENEVFIREEGVARKEFLV